MRLIKLVYYFIFSLFLKEMLFNGFVEGKNVLLQFLNSSRAETIHPLIRLLLSIDANSLH